MVLCTVASDKPADSLENELDLSTELASSTAV